MADEEAPPVVAVVVTSDPGPWFEECLEALAGQDYPNLSILVVDAASKRSPASRIAAVLPKAYFRASAHEGFAPSANEALGAVKGATHLLFCHDDVAPVGDAVRRMVEEAFRSNAGVVCPKYVAWNEPDRLLQVGLAVDRFGAPVPRVEVGEIDQSQHDEAQEVFAAPGGFTLVRADLFEAIGGFDPDITLFGEDVDFCWRAQIAGARVVLAPAASVRHLEATAGGVRERADKRSLQRRHELRAVLKNYGLVYRLVVVPQLVVLALVEIAYCLVVDDRPRAREVVAAWRWNLGHRRSLGAARKQVRHSRRLPDHVVSHQRAPARRLRNFVAARTRRGAGAPVADELGRAMGPAERRLHAMLHPGRRGEAIAAAVALVLVVAFGVRGLVTSTLPLLGSLAPFPSATSLLARFAGGWTSTGVQLNGPAPPVFGILGLAGVVLIGAMGVLQKVVLLGSIAAGGIGASRLLAPFSSPRARAAAAAAYLAFPLLWDDLARGDLAAIVAFGATPYILGRLARAARTPPFDHDRPLAGEIAGLGLLLAVACSLAPSIFVVTVFAASATALGLLAAGEQRAIARMLGVAAGGAATAFVITLPWSVSFLDGGAGWTALSGALAGASSSPGLSSLMRFQIGPVGAGLLGWGLLAAATLPLLVGRKDRLRAATRWWVTALGFYALAWAGVEGWLGTGGGATGVLLAPAAASLAASVALGVVAFEKDLPRYRFGWRQAATAAAAVCAVAGALPFLAATVGGRASLPSTGYEQVLGSYLDARSSATVPYRVLWLGDPGALPLAGWQIARGYELGLSENGLPDAESLWPSPSPGAAGRIEDDLAMVRAGLTVDVGRQLAQFGVRFIVVPSSFAPELTGVQSSSSLPPPAGLVEGLALQADLRELPDQAGSTVFVNADWLPASGREPLPGADRPPLSVLGSGAGAALEIVFFLAALVIAVRRPRARKAPRHAMRAATAAGDAPGGMAATSPTAAGGEPLEATEVVPEVAEAKP
jgi:GT2 family glycosyltransferase